MRNIESQTQQACVRYFRLQYPRYAGCFFSVPNGGRRDTVTGAILKAEGALAGVADLFLSVPNNVHHGLYVENEDKKRPATGQPEGIPEGGRGSRVQI